MPRRLTASLAIILTVAPLLGHGSIAVAAPTTAELDSAEARLEQLINQRRDKRDQRPFRHDERVASLARARSQDMIDRHYFDHRDRQGHFVDWYLSKAGVRFSRVGEIIAWGHGGDVLESAVEAVDMWMASSPHRREILSSNNYFGAGVATDGRTWKWTVVFITGRDRTDPVARFTSSRADGDTIRLGWTGYDPALVVGTAGLRGYDLERRRPGGSWSRIRTLTTKRSYAHVDPPGATFEFRLRARDKAGNIGRWTDPVSVTLPT